MPDEIESINSAGVATPAGHYSHATAWRDLVFASGQLGRRPDGTHIFGQPFEMQVRQTLANVLAVLSEAGCQQQNVLRVTVYLVGIENRPVFDRIYAEIFGDVRPARTVVQVSKLQHGYLVGIEAIAVRMM